MANVWIITSNAGIAPLVELGKKHGGKITAVVVSDADVAGVDEAIRIAPADGTPAEALAPAVVAAVKAEDGDLILAQNNPAERSLAGAVAANLNAPLLLGLKDVTADSATLSRYGGISVETVKLSGPAVAIVEGGAAVEDAAVAATDASGETYNAKVTDVQASEAEEVNLSAAKRIVAAGRGFLAEEDLKLAQDLADTLGAEVAASRPLVEGNGWMGHDSYIGVTGQHVSPELYVSVGISGQLQHTAGMTDSKTIVSINKDETAPMFEVSDYGIVGDLYEVLPALNQALK